ncbi:MAG: DNA-binding protein, partial [Achromobacter sp.]
ELWATLNRKMVDYLDSVSLQDLVDQQRVRQLQDASAAANSGSPVRVNRLNTTTAGSVTNAPAAA